jgi:hypothetical protein
MMKLPLLDAARAPSRFGIMVILCMALLAALTVERLMQRLRSPVVRNTLVVAALGLVVLETLPAEPHPVVPLETHVPAFVRELEDVAPQTYVLLNVPVDFVGARGGGGLFLMHQTIHRQTIVGGYLGREPVYVLRQLELSRFLTALHHRAYQEDKRISLDGISDDEILDALRDLDVDYVLLHPRQFREEDFGAVSERFRSVLGEPIYDDALVSVFQTAH